MGARWCTSMGRPKGRPEGRPAWLLHTVASFGTVATGGSLSPLVRRKDKYSLHKLDPPEHDSRHAIPCGAARRPLTNGSIPTSKGTSEGPGDPVRFNSVFDAGLKGLGTGGAGSTRLPTPAIPSAAGSIQTGKTGTANGGSDSLEVETPHFKDPVHAPDRGPLCGRPAGLEREHLRRGHQRMQMVERTRCDIRPTSSATPILRDHFLKYRRSGGAWPFLVGIRKPSALSM